jgi:hypothetical protein
MTPRLSLVLVAYEMRRELPRTIRSLSPPIQRAVERDDYELIVADNGSDDPPDRDQCEAFGAPIRWLAIEDPTPSPVPAANRAIAEASAPLVGVMIDGARLASPGILHHAIAASAVHPRPVIATLGLHLGPDLQRRSVAAGYDQTTEDELLDAAEWTTDGYRLFEISSLGGSSRGGWFEAPAESNALFMPADMWAELGGFDERFRSAGGGLANLDLFDRACALPDSQLIMLLGEATFHQIHGGVATNSPESARERLLGEYAEIRDRDYRPPDVTPLSIGTPAPQAMALIAASARGDAPASPPVGRITRRFINLLKRALLTETDDGRRRIARARLNHLDRCASTMLAEHVEGDLVFYGGSQVGELVLIRGILAAWGAAHRTVRVLASVEGAESALRAALERYDLLDDSIGFEPGLSAAPPGAPGPRPIALLRIEADATATTAALSTLHGQISPGGLVILAADETGDRGGAPAAEAFLAERGIATTPVDAPGGEICWRVLPD